ncbi:hypothetical protein D9M72_630150 [compost metagenome]
MTMPSAPVAWGAAMDVPLKEPYAPSSVVLRMSPPGAATHQYLATPHWLNF